MTALRPLPWGILLVACTGPRPEVQPGPGPIGDPPVVDTEPLDPASLVWSAEVSLDALGVPEPVVVVGLPGLLQDGGSLTVTNTSTGGTGSVIRFGDDSFVSFLEARLGEEVSALLATQDTLYRGGIDIAPANDGPELPAGPLWLPPDAQGRTALDASVLTGWDTALVVFNEATGEAYRGEGLDTLPGLGAEAADRLCVFAIDLDGVPGPIVCEESP